MYAVNCNEGVEEKIPSIIHVDGTCRIQTVSKEDNPIYHRIISKFKEKTGVPIVFNTSFNLGGEPLVETLEDALWTLQQSEIQYLYLPEYNKLLTVHNFNII
jgi:carbamoyltransferase